jgi:uncharacterized protein YndB with AHSA1/START domain
MVPPGRDTAMTADTIWTTHIKANPEAVFAVLGDIQNHSAWSVTTYTATKTSEGPVGVGTTYDSRGWLPGKGKEHLNHVTITEYEPPRKLSFDAVDPDGPVVRSEYVLTAEDGGTRVDRRQAFVRPPGVQGVLWPVLFLLVKRAVQKNLDMFKAVVESKDA